MNVFKNSKSIYIHKTNDDLLHIDRQTLIATELGELPADTLPVTFIKVRDRETAENLHKTVAIFGILTLPDGFTYLVTEPAEQNTSFWKKTSQKKELPPPDVILREGQNIYTVKRPLNLIQISPEKTSLSAKDKQYKNLFEQFPIGVSGNNEFFYSYANEYQLTKVFQEQNGQPSTEFLWNHWLLLNKTFHQSLNFALRWCVQLCHGYLAVTLTPHVKTTLIARRSRYFAGTRFLKRGCDVHGNCANSVEIEQIVENRLTKQFSSFTQYRGSVPGLWQQSFAEQAPGQVFRPKIDIYACDPTFRLAGKHFSWLSKRYGGTSFVLNLLRDKTITTHNETVISRLINDTVDYLKQCDESVQIENLDMANESKSTVLDKIEKVAKRLILKTGWYNDDSVCQGSEKFNTETHGFKQALYKSQLPTRQEGVIRANCLDCLGRWKEILKVSQKI